MSEEKWTPTWSNTYILQQLKKRLEHTKFADRVQMIRKLLKLIVETLDGMKEEVKKECP